MYAPPTVFVADDDLALVNAISTRCQAIGLRVLTASDASSAWQRIDRNRPQFIILDVDMPCGNGLSILEMIRTHEDLSETPVILLTGRTDRETVRRCHEYSSYYVPKGGEVWSRIEPILRDNLPCFDAAETADSRPDQDVAAVAQEEPLSLLDAVFASIGVNPGVLVPEEEAQDDCADTIPWVLSVDDDKAFAESLMLRLKKEGVGFRRAFSAKSGCDEALARKAHAILLDYEMPQGNGDELLRRLKEDPRTRSIPVIVLTGRNEKSIEEEMLGLGATAFFTKPYAWESLWEELRTHLPEERAGDLSSTGSLGLATFV